MINLALKTEYSFKQTLGRIADVVHHANGQNAIGIADTNGTYGHVRFEKICKEAGLKPIFGVRLMVVDRPEDKDRSRFGPEYIFIAKNQEGIKEINQLTKKAYEKFYYKAQIGTDDMLSVSNNVFVICECPTTLERLDYIALSPSTPKLMLQFDVPKVAMQNNRYSTPFDKGAYQCLAGARKMGTGYSYNFNDQTYPQHILSEGEWMRIWGLQEAVDNTYIIAEQCNVTLPRAPMVRYTGKISVDGWCRRDAMKRGVDLSTEPYKSRYERELALIREKDYEDYFLITAEMVRDAKMKMMVGPGRGSAAGSLICYLLGITEVEPIRHGLLFERFVDVNRMDLPDIDIDFPDVSRKQVIKQLEKKFDANNVCHLANINRLKARSAIGEVAMALSVPKFEVDILKDSIVDRSGGDARAALAAMDTLKTTDVGRQFLGKYPAVEHIVEKIEAHASHTGVHAGGIVVCNEPITNFGGVDFRANAVMMDKKDAEAKNLLKIDVLGLRTLSILEDAARLAGKDYKMYYSLPLDDEGAFKVINDIRMSGIFQFEGRAMSMLCKQMGVHNFDDVVALTALSRPGPLHSGAANKYILRRTGAEPVEHLCDHPAYLAATEPTYGVMVYQEQLMQICREVGRMSWEDVSAIRTITSKTLGKEHFDKYRVKFLAGAKENGIEESKAIEIWEGMLTFGSWGMNKSHAVSYGYISYWCAYMKANYPLEFAAANLNNASSDEGALKMLRDAVKYEGIEYTPVDADESDVKWTIKDGKLLGGLTNIHGIAEKKALDIVRGRKTGKAPTPSIIMKLLHPTTPFDILYPTEHYFGEYYERWTEFGLQQRPHYTVDIDKDDGEYIILGRVWSKDLRDLNEYNELVKRGGKVLTENDKSLRIVVEDDTSQILCIINRFAFNKMRGAYWAEKLVVDESYVIIKGTISGGWRILNVNAMHEIGRVDKIKGLLEKY